DAADQGKARHRAEHRKRAALRLLAMAGGLQQQRAMTIGEAGLHVQTPPPPDWGLIALRGKERPPGSAVPQHRAPTVTLLQIRFLNQSDGRRSAPILEFHKKSYRRSERNSALRVLKHAEAA